MLLWTIPGQSFLVAKDYSVAFAAGRWVQRRRCVLSFKEVSYDFILISGSREVHSHRSLPSTKDVLPSSPVSSPWGSIRWNTLVDWRSSAVTLFLSELDLAVWIVEFVEDQQAGWPSLKHIRANWLLGFYNSQPSLIFFWRGGGGGEEGRTHCPLYPSAEGKLLITWTSWLSFAVWGPTNHKPSPNQQGALLLSSTSK